MDVFFVISGFLITTHLLSEQYKTGTISLLSFYSKRLKRLYPAIVFTILITAVLMSILFWGYDQNIKDFVTSVKYALFGVANFYFLRKEGDYFNSTTDDDPLLHFWSLGVEEQFYLI